MMIIRYLCDHQKGVYLLAGVFLFLISFSFSSPSCAVAAQYEQVSGLIDLRTNFSDGAYTIEQLAQMAKNRGFGALFITDHDRMALSYGLPPFRNLLKKSEEHNSINFMGADRYLRTISDAQKKFPDLIIIPGSETASFYYWTGNPLSGDLTAHDHEKRLLTIGMDKPQDYEQLPILHNNSAFNLESFDPATLFFVGAALFSALLIFWKGRLRIIGIVSFILSVLLLLNSDPLKNSPFDAYSGAQGNAPYQLVIDYVNNRGGMTFWNYPETRSGVRKLGPIQVSTKPYPGIILETKGYTGFSAVYGEATTITEPGNLWDMALLEYCRGFRMWPPWAIATADYHGEGQDGARLGNYPTVFLVREKTKQAVLKAMQTGKMYASYAPYPVMPRMDEFSVSSPEGQKVGNSGDEISMKGYPKIRISLSALGSVQAGPVKVRLIRSGSIISTAEGKLPITIEHEDPYVKPGEKIFYRMDMRGGAGVIVSNPIFVAFER